jgi:hypothetical protein
MEDRGISTGQIEADLPGVKLLLQTSARLTLIPGWKPDILILSSNPVERNKR